MLTSDSESEIFCDSVDSVEQLGSVKVQLTHRKMKLKGKDEKYKRRVSLHLH